MKRLLLSNDDGIHATGIRTLHAAVKDLGHVDVVAPAEERSAVGHAITLYDPIKTWPITEEHFQGHAVGGTPADSVKLAVCAFLKEKPDLLISGINLGPNSGISVIYSGTVSAATEGTILGIPSMAISLNSYTHPQWASAAAIARHLATRLLATGLPPDTLLNVNVPNLPLKEIRGMRITRMGRSRFVETFERRNDPRGNVYYWMDGFLEQIGDMGGTDIEALEQGYVSLTPIWFDLTNHTALKGLSTLAQEGPPI